MCHVTAMEPEPQILGKHQTRFEGFDDKILSMYARGMTTREIQGHLQEICGVEVSPTLISEVTNPEILALPPGFTGTPGELRSHPGARQSLAPRDPGARSHLLRFIDTVARVGPA